MRRRHQVLLTCLAALAVPAAPAGAVFNPLPDTSVQTNGTITAFAESGSRIFLGGRFTRVGVPVTGGAVFNAADGSLDPSIPRAGKGSVLASVADGAGGWYVGGNFSSIGSAPRTRLAHILADGTVDPSFTPAVNNNVYTLLLSGGVLYAGGDFSLVGSPGVARNHVAAFDAATGALLSFAPNITGTVRALALSGGTLYAGGTFRIVESGITIRSRLAAYDTATSAMTSFNAGLDDADLNEVRTLALSGGTLYVGGLFNSANGGTPRRNLAAFDTATGSATSFDPNVNGRALSLEISGSTVYAGGEYTTANGSTPRNHLAAFDAATGAVTSFNPNVGTGASDFVASLSLSGSTLYAGGEFQTVSGAATRNRLAAFDTSTGSTTSFDPNVDATVFTVATAPGGKIYAGGNFQFVGAGTIRNYVAAITRDGQLDPTFNPNVNGVNTGTTTVAALAVAGGRLYAGGTFSTVNGGAAIRNNLTAFDTTTGAVDAAFNPNVNTTVRALATSGATVYAGGDFTMVNGSVPRTRIAAFDATSGIVDAGFNPSIVGVPGINGIFALATSGGKVYAGGDFLAVNGTARNNLAALDGAGVLDPSFNPNMGGSDARVTSLLVSGSKVYAGGNFTTVNGGVARNRLVALDASGTVDPAFVPSVGNQVAAMTLSGGVLYLGGMFTNVNGSVRFFSAAVDPTTGALNAAFNPGMGSVVFAILASGSRLYSGGQFTTIGSGPALQGPTQLRLAVFSDLAAPAVVTGAASAVGDTGATLSGTVNPNGTATSYVFEYGTTASFGSITPPDGTGAGTSPASMSKGLTGLAANTTYYYRLVASSAAGTTFGSVLTFRTTGAAAQAPVVVTQAPTGVTNTSAVLNGQINPSGRQTAFTFEYGTSTSFGAITPVVALDDADALEPVSATLTGLQPDTTYYYRVVATNATGTSIGAVQVFSTGPGGSPIVATGAASSITTTGATLAATVDAHGSQTAYTFEYGTGTGFGAISAVANAGSANGVQSVALPVTGLTPGTTYLYRVVATNANGTTAGAVHSFTTPAAA